MKLCIDSADTVKIRTLYEMLPVDGVSTNPTILARANRNPYDVLKEIREIIGEDELFVQAVSTEAEKMVHEAERILSALGERTLIKIPCMPEGYKAMKLLSERHIRFIGTAVYTPMQGILAAKCGAEYVAPYVNRIDNMGYDGVHVAGVIHEAIVANKLTHSGLLAASFKNARQVLELITLGVKGVTVSPDILEAMMSNASVDAAVTQFQKDFAGLCGPHTMLDC